MLDETDSSLVRHTFTDDLGPYDALTRPWYLQGGKCGRQQISSTGVGCMSKIYLSTEGTLVLTFVLAFFNATGARRGVFAVDVNTGSLARSKIPSSPPRVIRVDSDADFPSQCLL